MWSVNDRTGASVPLNSPKEIIPPAPTGGTTRGGLNTCASALADLTKVVLMGRTTPLTSPSEKTSCLCFLISTSRFIPLK